MKDGTVAPDEESALSRFRKTALEHYATNPAGRAAVAAIPFLGGGIDALLGTAGSNLLIARLEVFFDELRAALDAVNDRLDTTVTEGQLYDAAIKALRGSIETGDREKVRILVAILAEAATRDRPDQLDAETVLGELVNLSSASLRVARQMYDEAAAESHPVNAGVPAPSGDPDADFHTQRLEAAGLIQVVHIQAQAAGGIRPARYEPTPTFRRIMAMVRHDISHGVPGD